MKDILQTIAENKKREVKALFDKDTDFVSIFDDAFQLPVYSMAERLRTTKGGIIAEFKRRSPSKGEISPMADICEIIPEYLQSGAAACSVLTDTRFFGGAATDLSLARTLSQNMPLLRKDFIISESQIIEARKLGASAVLLIAAILSKEELKKYNSVTHDLGMEALIEIHDINELDKICFTPDMLGVNNRNLASFHTDISHSYELIDSLPKDTVLVAESGIRTPDDVKRLKNIGFTGFLIGEAFMSSPNPGKTLKQFINAIE